MARANPRLWRLFDEGMAQKALIGKGTFFIPAVTFRDRHDRLLVLHQLGLWAKARGAHTIAEAAFVGACEDLLEVGDIEGALDVIWSAMLLRKEYKVPAPIPTGRLHALAHRTVAKSGYPDLVDGQLKAVAAAVLREAGESD